MKDWTDDLINAHVDCDAENDIIETLKQLSSQNKLEGWLLEPLNIPGAHPWCLRNGHIRVALCQTRKNIVMTANVLPVDELHDAKKSNAYIKILHDIFNSNDGILSSNIG
ncbi:hypothetical protein ACTM6I_03560 [Citrobacter freundii]